MKKIAILLAVCSMFCFSNGTNANAAYSTNNAASNIYGNSIAANTSLAQDTMVLGKLYFVNIKEGEQPVMTGLSLFGNRCGSESFNHKPYAEGRPRFLPEKFFERQDPWLHSGIGLEQRS